MKVRNFERRVRAGLEEKPLPKVSRPEPEAPKAHEPRVQYARVEEPTQHFEPIRRGPGNGTIGFLAVSVVAMSLYLAMGGSRLIWPNANSSLTTASASADAAPRGARSSGHKLRVQRRIARTPSVPGGYVGPIDDFAPADADFNDTVMVRSIGAWNSAYGSFGHWLDDESLSSLHIGMTTGVSLAQEAVSGLFDSLPSSNPAAGISLDAPMMAGTAAFIAVLVMCIGVGGWIAVRASRDERKHVFRFDGYYQ